MTAQDEDYLSSKKDCLPFALHFATLNYLSIVRNINFVNFIKYTSLFPWNSLGFLFYGHWLSYPNKLPLFIVGWEEDCDSESASKTF